MIFLKPEYLIMMLVPALILFYFIVSQKSLLDQYFDIKILEKLRFDNDTLGKVGRNILLFAALFLIIVALARPVHEKGDVAIKTKTIDMMVALDVSKSMMAGDFYPSRLAFAKKRFVEFVESFKEANIGVIAFSSEGFLLSPMTQDGGMLKYLVNNLSLDSMNLQGTNLLIPIEKAKDFLKKSKEKILIIFTDGGDNSDFSREIEKATAYKETIYIYAIATAAGAPILRRGSAVKDKKGDIVITKLNTKIKQLAFESGGAYVVGNYDDNSIKIMVEDIQKKFTLHRGKEKHIKEYQELFYYPLALALMFLLFAFHSFPRRGGMAIAVLAMVGLFQGKMEAGMFDFFDIAKAKEAYQAQKYKEAAKHFESIVKSTKNAQSMYDLANAHYKTGDYKKAISTYDKVVTTDANLVFKKRFNQGNAYFQLKDYKKAIAVYERAQEIKNTKDLIHNLALAKAKLKEQQQNQQQNDQKSTDKKEQQKEQKRQNQDKEKKEPKKKKQENKKKKEKPEQGKREENAAKENAITAKEEKLWQQYLEDKKIQTMPLKFKELPIKRSVDEKPW